MISGDSNFNFPTCYEAGYEFLGREIFEFVGKIIKQVLFEKVVTTEWIKNSNVNSVRYYPLLLLRLVVTLCLLCLNYGQHFEVLYGLFGRSDITSYLPWDFINVLKRKRGRNFNVTANTVAEAFIKIGNPLFVVSLKGNRPKYSCGEATFVDINATSAKDDVLRILFPIEESLVYQGQGVENENTKLRKQRNNNGQLTVNPSSKVSSVAGQNIKIKNEYQINTEINLVTRELILNAWNSLTSPVTDDGLTYMLRASEIKVKVENHRNLLLAAMTSVLGDYTYGIFDEGDKILEELQHLSSALDDMDGNATVAPDFLRRLMIAKPMLDTLLDLLLMNGDANADDEAMKKRSSTERADDSDGIALQSENHSGTKDSGKITHSENKPNAKKKSKRSGKNGKKR